MAQTENMRIIRCTNKDCNKVIYKAGSELSGRVETKCRSCKHTFTIKHRKQ